MDFLIVIVLIFLISIGLSKVIDYGDNHGWFLGNNHYHQNKKH